MPTTHLPTPSSQNPPPTPTNNPPSKTGPPTRPLRRKSYKQHIHNERNAIKKHLDRFIATTSTTTVASSLGSSSSTSSAELSSSSSASASSSEADKRWTLLLAQRAEKLRERVERGKGSTQNLFPEFWNSEREVAWLRRGWRGFLEGGGGKAVGSADVDGCGKAGLVVGRGEDRDDEEEMVGFMGVKKEEGEGGDEVGSAGLGCGGGRSQQMAGIEGSSQEVKGEEEVRGRLDGMDEQGRGLGRTSGRSRGKARLENEDVVGFPCSRGWAIQDSSVEAMEGLVDTAETGIADVVLGFAGPRGAVFEPMATGEAETDDFEPGTKRKAESEVKLPGKKIKKY
ncbi:hypothetical protein KC355_g1933 [Hortaea werneckii]|nr:hypothetical protein KC355_g1933 [Hortaea werneckii]